MAKKFLYFAEADVTTTDTALLVPVSAYRGCDPGGTTTTAFYFEVFYIIAARLLHAVLIFPHQQNQ